MEVKIFGKLCDRQNCRNIITLSEEYCSDCKLKPSYQKDYRLEYIHRTPLHYKKHLARSRLNAAIKLGKIQRELCEEVFCNEFGEGHHDDYDQPLKVRWLCKNHHTLHHLVK